MERKSSSEEVEIDITKKKGGKNSPNELRNKKAQRWAAQVFSLGLSLVVAEEAKGDEFVVGMGPSATMELRNEAGGLLGNFPISVGPNSEQADAVSLDSEEVTLVSVYSSNGTGDVFEVNEFGATPLNLGLIQPNDLSVDIASGLWSVADFATGELKVCEISNRTNCESFAIPGPAGTVLTVELNLSAPEPYIVTWASQWSVVSLGQNVDSDPFPDGVPTLRAGGAFSTSALDALMNRFNLNTGESITFALGTDSLFGIEVDGSSLTSLANATATEITPLGLIIAPANLNGASGKLLIAGNSNTTYEAAIAKFAMGNTSATTSFIGTIENSGWFSPAYRKSIAFDSNGFGWLMSSNFNGDHVAEQFDVIGTLAWTGETRTFTSVTSNYSRVFSILGTTPTTDPDNDGDGVPASADCDDDNATIYPGAPETCDDGINSNCGTGDNDGATFGLVDSYPDADYDGDAAIGATATAYCPSEVPSNTQPNAGADCDDNDPARSSLLTEILSNGIDDDCDSATSDIPADPDFDGDGFPASADCDDNNATIYPGAPQTCDDGINSNCGTGDNDGATLGLVDRYPDADYDGDAAVGATATAYCPSEVPSDTQPTPGADCADNNPARNSFLTEILSNGIDDDCDPATLDTPLDPDNDSDGVPASADCDDNNAMIYPGAPELANGLDNDCNGDPAIEVGQDIQNRDESVLGSTTNPLEAGPNFIEAGGDNIIPVQIERNTDVFGDPVDLFTYRRSILALPGNFTVDRAPGGPQVIVYEVPQGAPPDYVSATSAAVTGSRLNVQANADGTTLYTVLNMTGNHRVEIASTAYDAEVCEAYLAANPSASNVLELGPNGYVFILGTNDSLLADSFGQFLTSSVAEFLAFDTFAENYVPGDDDDSSIDDDDSADDDDSSTDDDDTTPDDDDSTADDDDTTPDDDDTTPDDDDSTVDDDDSTPDDDDVTPDDDDSSTEVPPGCEGGCGVIGENGETNGAALMVAVMLVGMAFRRRETEESLETASRK